MTSKEDLASLQLQAAILFGKQATADLARQGITHREEKRARNLLDRASKMAAAEGSVYRNQGESEIEHLKANQLHQDLVETQVTSTGFKQRLIPNAEFDLVTEQKYPCPGHSAGTECNHGPDGTVAIITFTVTEQARHNKRGFPNRPRVCRPCKAIINTAVDAAKAAKEARTHGPAKDHSDDEDFQDPK